MTPWRNALWAAAAFCLAGALATPGALAHGAVGYDQDSCVLKVGPDFMYFSGYLPGKSKAKFCEAVPETGQAVIVLDFAQDELREMTTQVRIVRDGPGAEAEDAASLDPITVAHLSPKIYPNGTLSLEHLFGETGNFVGIVVVDGLQGEHWVSRFPFSVGGAATPRAPYYLLAAAAGLALILLIYGRSDRFRRSKSRG